MVALMVARASRPLKKRIRSTLFLIPAWFSQSAELRAAFHRARGARIGESVEIGYFVIIDNLYPEKVAIDEGATVSARSTILAHDESKAYTKQGAERIAETKVGPNAFLGVHCVVMPGVTIGANAIVGAGAVVTRDVPPGAVVAGVPARPINAHT